MERKDSTYCLRMKEINNSTAHRTKHVIRTSTKRYQRGFIPELLVGWGSKPLCGGGLGAVLSAPPEVSPLPRTTQGNPPGDIHGQRPVCSGCAHSVSWDHFCRIIWISYLTL